MFHSDNVIELMGEALRDKNTEISQLKIKIKRLKRELHEANHKRMLAEAECIGLRRRLEAIHDESALS